MSSSAEPSVESREVEENFAAPLWKYVTKHEKSVGGGGNIPFTCSFCKRNYKGSYSRVKAHLLKLPRGGIAPCPKVTAERLYELNELVDSCEKRLKDAAPKKVPLPPSSSIVNSSLGGAYFSQLDRDTEPKKRKAMTGPVAKAYKLEEREQCDAKVARMFYTGGLSFNLAKNPYYKSSYVHASQIPSYVPPGYNALKTTLLQKEKCHIERMLEPTKKTWKDIGVSLCSDGWTDSQRRPLINIMAASESGPMYLKAINCEGEFKDKYHIADLLTNCIHEIGPENVVQVVIDNAPVCKAAGALVEGVFPYIFWTPCVVHTHNLALKDILKAKSPIEDEDIQQEVGWIMNVVEDAWYIKIFIMNHNMRLSMYNGNCSLKLLQVVEMRFASHIVSLKKFREVKEGLQQMVISLKWDMYKEDNVEKARVVKQKLLDDFFWDKIDFILAFMGSIYDMIRMTDTHKPCHHLVYEWWDTMIEKVRKAIYMTEFSHVILLHCEVSRFYNVVYSIIISRWTKSSTPLHCVVHSLNPRFYSFEWLEEDPNRIAPHKDIEITTERKLCFGRYFPSAEDRRKVNVEYAYFSMCMNDYSDLESLENRFHFEPVVWWGIYGSSTPTLQKLAFKLLRQPSSSSCCEKNWSTYSFIHSLKRNKLEPQRAQDLVFVHTNLRLLSRKHPSYYKSVETMWDIAGDEHDSMAPGSVDVLELATLSLDEPTLEGVLFGTIDENESVQLYCINSCHMFYVLLDVLCFVW